MVSQNAEVGDRPGKERSTLLFTKVASDFDIVSAVRLLWRRKLVVFVTVLIVGVSAFIYISQLPNLYTATVSVIIEGREDRTLPVESVIGDLNTADPVIRGEVAVIRSRGLAEKVIAKQGLVDNVELNPPPNEVTGFRRYLSVQGVAQALLPAKWDEAIFGPKPLPPAPEKMLEAERTKVVNAFLSRLSVAPAERSPVIHISFTSRNPETAARVANAIADQYIVEQLEAKFEATRRASAWLDTRLRDLQDEVGALEREIADYRQNSGLVQAQNTSLIEQQVVDMNADLSEAAARRTDMQARLRQVRSAVESNDGIDSIEEVLSSPLIQQLRTEESLLNRRAAELSAEYGDRHPRMINLRAEITDLRDKIRFEASKIVGSLENEYQGAVAREAAIRNGLERMTAQLSDVGLREVQLNELERNLEAKRDLLQTFLARFQETEVQENIQRPDARVISPAAVPVEPSQPKKKPLFLIALAGGFVLAGALVFLLEKFDQTFRSAEEIESMMGVSMLGLVPHAKSRLSSRQSFVDYLMRKPLSRYAEAIRGVQTGFRLLELDEEQKSFLITSTGPQEGKSTLAVSLALTEARSGRKTILIDADLRRPTLHSFFEIEQRAGLVEVITGEKTLDEVVYQHEPSGLFVLTSGADVPNPIDLLGSQHMSELLALLEQSFDHILIDSPPVSAVADARILARKVSRALYLVRWGTTRRDVAMRGLRQLVDDGARLAGVVLTVVHVDKHARYGFSDSGAYYRGYDRYYRS